MLQLEVGTIPHSIRRYRRWIFEIYCVCMYIEWAHKGAQDCLQKDKSLIFRVLCFEFLCTKGIYYCAFRYLFVQIIIIVQDLCKGVQHLCRRLGCCADC